MHGEVHMTLFPLPSTWEDVFWLIIIVPKGDGNCVTQYEEYSSCVWTKGLSAEQISRVKGTILNLHPRPNSPLASDTHQINQRQCHRFDFIAWHYAAIVHGLASPLGSFWAQDWIDNKLVSPSFVLRSETHWSLKVPWAIEKQIDRFNRNMHRFFSSNDTKIEAYAKGRGVMFGQHMW